MRKLTENQKELLKVQRKVLEDTWGSLDDQGFICECGEEADDVLFKEGKLSRFLCNDCLEKEKKDV